MATKREVGQSGGRRWWAGVAALLLAAALLAVAELEGESNVDQPSTQEGRCGSDDAACIGTRELPAAEPLCRQRIEAQLTYKHRWLESWTTDVFATSSWYTPPDQVIYRGTQMEAQNGFGAWSQLSYFCVWDVGNQQVVKVGVSP